MIPKNLSMRDYFAGLALQGLIGRLGKDKETNHAKMAKRFAAAAYEYADAMLAAREPKSAEEGDPSAGETPSQ